MKKIKFISFLFIFVPLHSQNLTAKEIIKMVYNLDQPNSFISEIKLEIIRTKNGKKKTKTREFTRFKKNYSKGRFKSKSLIRFQKPLAISGTGLLSWDYKSGKSEQWFFLPKLKTAKKVHAKEKHKNFMGTDFIYEDLENRKLGMDSLSIVGTEFIDGHPCKVIMAWPKNESVYFSRKLWVNTQNWQIIKIEFYSSEVNKIKTLTVSNFIEKNDFIIPGDMKMERDNGNITLMKIQSFKPNIGLKDEIFSESFMIKI